MLPDTAMQLTKRWTPFLMLAAATTAMIAPAQATFVSKDDGRWFLEPTPSNSRPPGRPILEVCRVEKIAAVPATPPKTVGLRRKKGRPYQPPYLLLHITVAEASDDHTETHNLWFSTATDTYANINPPRDSDHCGLSTTLDLRRQSTTIDTVLIIYAVDEDGNWSPPCSLQVEWIDG